jgi:tRNA-Thr(GGU) m(6)t(6)A37 methyltransferase TsaA
MSVSRCVSIGIIHSPFPGPSDTPIQPTGAVGVEGTIEIEPELAPGLEDLEGFSHLILLYHFHLCQGFSLTVAPFLDDKSHGVFATRAPRRPNPIGLSVVRLLRREGSTLWVSDLDIVDGTPLLDIKPYVPEFDAPQTTRIGWLEGKTHLARGFRSDDRFSG